MILPPTEVHPICNRNRCFYCNKKMVQYKEGDWRSRTVDHVVPKSVGGLDIRLNRVWSCRSCNQNKGSMIPKTKDLIRLGIRFGTCDGLVEIQWRDPRKDEQWDYAPDPGYLNLVRHVVPDKYSRKASSR